MAYVLIPRRYEEAVNAALNREARAKGVDPSKIELRIKRVFGSSAVLINWVVHYVNTTGRRDFASYVAKSGKVVVMGSLGSLNAVDFKASEYSSAKLEEDTEVSSKDRVYKVEAKDYLTCRLSDNLRVPRRAIKIISADEVIIAKKVSYGFRIGESSGEVEVDERLLPRVHFEPLPMERLEEKVLALCKRYGTGGPPRKVLEGRADEVVDKVKISRSWDFLFDGKGKTRVIESTREELGSPHVVSRGVSGSHASFIIRAGDKFRLVGVNRYSGAIVADLPIAGPEELREDIRKALADLISQDPSKVEVVPEDISNLYGLRVEGTSISVVSEAKLRVTPLIYHVRYDHSNGKIDITRREVDDDMLRDFLFDKLRTSDFSYEYDYFNLYVRAKTPEGWSFMIFNLTKLRGSPDLAIQVDRIFHDPKTDSYVVLCRPEGSSSCLAFWMSRDMGRVHVSRSPCLDEIAEIVRNAISSRFRAEVKVRVDHEQRTDFVASRISPKTLFTVSRDGKGDAFLQFTGFDSTRTITFKASYSMRSGTVILEEPHISEDKLKEMVERSTGLRNVNFLDYKCKYPFLYVKVRGGGEILSLKFDLSDISNPWLAEKKVHRGILGTLRDVLF